MSSLHSKDQGIVSGVQTSPVNTPGVETAQIYAPLAIPRILSREAQEIVTGYARIEEARFRLTLPPGSTVLKVLETLDVEASRLGLARRILSADREQRALWRLNERYTEQRTVPGEQYVVSLDERSGGRTRAEQTWGGVRGAPLGIIAIAEACELLVPSGFRALVGNPFERYWVRGASPGFAVMVHDSAAVRLQPLEDSCRGPGDLFAALVR